MARPDPVAVPADRRRALDEALERLAPSRGSEGARSSAAAAVVRRLSPVAASCAPFPEALDPRLVAVLTERGIAQLYTHQAQALVHALAGRHVVVVTPTASGKTLCYNAPVLHAMLQEAASRALYLFPTKALAQDQLAELEDLTARLARRTAEAIPVATYDGDTPHDARAAIRARARIVLSNPDMLHTGILPHHPRWATLFENLRYVVLDELHTCRGVFGSHLANILRRLGRVCRYYGSDPVFICASATIANPRELAERLTGKPFELVDVSGAPRGEQVFVFLNPPLVNAALGIRRSYLAEARRAAMEFLERGLQVIVFAQSRLATEILTTYLKEAFAGSPGSEETIRGYRGGYLPRRRREIEKGLREGRVRGVVSTNALELGIDIGSLDVVVMAGYPGTIAATWQRAGRAGRRAGRSVAVLVATSAPLDQFIVRHPEYFFGRSPEHALINPDNLHIFVEHLKCAAFELPFVDGELFGETPVDPVLEVLAEAGFLHHAEGRWHWVHESYPADAVSLRSVSSDNFVVVDVTDQATVIGDVDFSSALATLHEQAIYLVEGQLYQVERLDVRGRKAYVRQVDCDYFTDAITSSRVTVLDEFDADPVAGCATHAHGEVQVVSRVVGFKKIKFYTNETVGSGELDLPEQQMHSTAYWLRLHPAALASLALTPEDRRDGVVGLASALKLVAQLLLMCDGHDLGVSIDGVADPQGWAGPARWRARESGPQGSHEAAETPCVFLYDNFPGGVGLSAPLYALRAALLEQTRELIASCPCPSGCPSCVGPPDAVGPRAKEVALRLLALLTR